MQFIRTTADFNGSLGFSYYPVTAPTNYRRVVVLEPSPRGEGEQSKPGVPTSKFYFFEYFTGQKVWVKEPLTVSKKRKVTGQQDLYLWEEIVEQESYLSPPVTDPVSVAQFEAWLLANLIV